MNHKKIVVVGTIFMDIKGYPEGEFYPTGRNQGRIEYRYGGVARNVAEDLAGLDYRPIFVSMADTAGPGSDCVQQLKAAGVRTEHILLGESCIGTWMVILTPEGTVCANLSKRQDLMPLCEYLDQKGEELFTDADGIMLEMDIEETLAEQVCTLAERHHVPVYGVISNINIAKERPSHIRKTHCFICNRQEAGVLFDLDMEHMGPQEILSVIKPNMERLGIRTMVVTMDQDGAVYADVSPDAEESGWCPAQKVAVVDSTGAGDAFFAGVSASLMEGSTLAEACRVGTGMAAQVITSTENVYRNLSHFMQ